jgi:hypothetical protein
MRRTDPATRAILLLGAVLALELAWLESMGVGVSSHTEQAPDSVTSEDGVERTSIPREDDPEPTPEPEAPELLRQQDRSCAIQVIGPDGTPANCREVVAVERGGTTIVASGLTGDDGVAGLPAEDRVADLLIDAGGCIHREPDVRLEAGRHVVTIPPGVAILGRVMLGDRPARASDGLSVDFLRDEAPALDALPAAIRRAVDPYSPLPISCKVGDGGAFRREGFEAGWKGRLVVRPFERVDMVDATRPSAPVLTIDVTAPASDLVLTARLRPVVRGRVAVGQDPRIGDRLVGVAICGREASRRSSVAARESEGWRFEIPVPLDAAPPLFLRLSTWSSGDLARVVEIDSSFDGDVDVGAIDFPGPAARRRILVTDREDRPIEGAVVALAGEPGVRGRPTGADGATDLDVTPRGTRLAVSALGWTSAEVDLGASDDPAHVRLERTTRIDVSVVSDGPGSMTSVTLALAEPAAATHAAPPMVTVDPFHEGRLTLVPIGRAWTRAWSGDASFADLPSGVPIVVNAVDLRSLARASTRIVLEPAEWRRIELALPAADARLSARVADEQGAPIAKAWIDASRDRSSGTGPRWSMAADKEGRFELPRIAAGPLDLSISAEGFVPLSLTVDPKSFDGWTFVLRRGRSLRVFVVDESGEPFVRPWYGPGCHHDWEIWITSPGSDFRLWPDQIPSDSMGGSPQSPAGYGNYEFRGLDGPVTIHVEGVGEKVYTFEHDGQTSEARVVVPAHGRLRANLGLRLDSQCSRLRLEPASPGLTPLAVADSGLEYEGGMSLPAVVPGDYRASFETLDARGAWQPATAERLISIRPGALTTVTLNRGP